MYRQVTRNDTSSTRSDTGKVGLNGQIVMCPPGCWLLTIVDLRPQEMIYEDIGAPVVRNALLGFNCSIFAYGQTGSVSRRRF